MKVCGTGHVPGILLSRPGYSIVFQPNFSGSADNELYFVTGGVVSSG